MQDVNRDTLPFLDNKSSDVRLSHWEYHDFIDQLLDDRLTAEGLMKFKRLHAQLAVNALAIPLVTFPFASYASSWLAGHVNRGMASTRYKWMGISIFWPLFMYYGFTRPTPRKLYTDIICDSGPDGTYVREMLRTRKPGLWSKVSHQLHKNNFNFPEMNEFKGTDFGWGFIGSRII